MKFEVGSQSLFHIIPTVVFGYDTDDKTLEFFIGFLNFYLSIKN